MDLEDGFMVLEGKVFGQGSGSFTTQDEVEVIAGAEGRVKVQSAAWGGCQNGDCSPP